MGTSLFGDALKRSSDVLRVGASSQVVDYEQRFSSLKNLYDCLLADMIVTGCDHRKAYAAALDFFGEPCVRFAGIDGTMYSRPLFDFVVFFGGAYASTGTLTFCEDGLPRVEYDRKTLQQAAGISSVVPIYVNDVPEVDQTFSEDASPVGAGLNRLATEESIVNNSAIANWIMTFAEHYLAYTFAANTDRGARVILLDRSLSIERASLIYDTAKRELWKAKSSLVGYVVDGEPIDVNDMAIARQCVCNEKLGLPPPRGDYLGYAVVDLLRKSGPHSEQQILAELGIADEQRARRLKRHVKRLVDASVLSEKDGAYSLNPKYVTTSERIKKLVKEMGERFFYAKTSDIQTSSVMKILKDGKEHWLTTLDIAFLTLFTLHLLMEECWKKRILLVGVTKDTAARDFKRQLIPIMDAEALLKKPVLREEFETLPNTDRMILQSASILNAEKIRPPWALIEYDSAFRTMVPDRENRKGYVSGAIKNRIGLEKAFLKTYVQLSQARSDPILRSNVLLIDRLVYPEYDCRSDCLVEFANEFGGAKEPVQAILFRDNTVRNDLQNLVMSVLVAMAPSSIPEAFGHNKALFVADKVAKWNYGQFKRVLDTTATWIVNNRRLRGFIFYMSTFRERRATIEQARREQD